MKITYINEANEYKAPGHFDVRALRLQGFDVSESENFWVGLSHFLPGGGCEMDASPLEKTYVVTAGTVTIIQGDKQVELGPMDSIFIGAGEERQILNNTNMPASMIVIMPYPENSQH